MYLRGKTHPAEFYADHPPSGMVLKQYEQDALKAEWL